MGNWRIVISGHGIHDNGIPNDADRLARDFATELRERGHDSVTGAFETLNGDGTVASSTPFSPRE